MCHVPIRAEEMLNAAEMSLVKSSTSTPDTELSCAPLKMWVYTQAYLSHFLFAHAHFSKKNNHNAAVHQQCPGCGLLPLVSYKGRQRPGHAW